MEVLLALGPALDTTDHKILIERLKKWVGLSGSVLDWSASYLKGQFSV